MTLLAEVIADSKAHGDKMGPAWGRQDPGGPYVCVHEPWYLGSYNLLHIIMCWH